jgi:hypothetical protein
MFEEWFTTRHRLLKFLKAASELISKKWLGSQIKSATM